MSKDTVGPAFPVTVELCQDLTIEQQRGMTLRDYFAAKAMEAIITRATHDHSMIVPRTSNGFPIDRNGSTETAYQWADAMLAERAK